MSIFCCICLTNPSHSISIGMPMIKCLTNPKNSVCNIPISPSKGDVVLYPSFMQTASPSLNSVPVVTLVTEFSLSTLAALGIFIVALSVKLWMDLCIHTSCAPLKRKFPIVISLLSTNTFLIMNLPAGRQVMSR